MKLTMKKALLIPFICLGLFTSATAWSEIAIIVHPSNSDTLDMSEVRRIFLGKKKAFPSGGQVISIDQAEGSDIRANFNRTVLNKSEQQVKTYWAQMLFTGKGTPPKSANSDEEVKKLVSENPALVGYIDAASVDDSIKVILKF